MRHQELPGNLPSTSFNKGGMPFAHCELKDAYIKATWQADLPKECPQEAAPSRTYICSASGVEERLTNAGLAGSSIPPQPPLIIDR